MEIWAKTYFVSEIPPIILDICKKTLCKTVRIHQIFNIKDASKKFQNLYFQN